MRKKFWTALALGVLASASVVAAEAQWKEAGNGYKRGKHDPVRSLALAVVDVRAGTHLERLSLISGEGHTGKKVMSGLLAGAATAMGGGGGIDFASREPLEEHFAPDDAKKIATEVAQAVAEHLKIANVTLQAGSAVTGNAVYGTLPGLSTEVDKDKLSFKEGRFGSEYLFGYWKVPAGDYRYYSAPMFQMSDKTFSPVLRQALGADATVRVNVFFVNTRKQFRIHELTVSIAGSPWSGDKKGADMDMLTFTLNDAGKVAVPVTAADHKDNYAHWQALRPQFEAQLDALSARIQAALPAS